MAGAEARMSAVNARAGSFSEGIQTLLKTVRYVNARSPEDRNDIFRLRYEANLREGTIGPNETGMFKDDYDDLPNCFNVGVYVEGHLAAALRMHLLNREDRRSVLMAAFPDIVPDILDRGATIIDVTRLVADFQMARTRPGLAYATVRLSMMAAAHFGADTVMAAVRREHVPFYRREFLATKLCEPRPYPTLIKPLALFSIDFERDFSKIAARHPFYLSTEAERAAVFGERSRLPAAATG
jgi:hypothetical protein